MDHRYNSRISVTADVLVYCQGEPVARARARNIGLMGMFLEFNPASISKCVLLEVEFTVGIGGEAKRLHVPAMVVHREHDGCGVEIEISDPEARQTIRSLIKVQEQLNRSGEKRGSG